MTRMGRRAFLGGAVATGAAALGTGGALAAPRQIRLARKWWPQVVAVPERLQAGQIHVSTGERFLYLTLGGGRARRYGIAVGAAGRNFRGTAVVARKAAWPGWVPTAAMVAAEPEVYGPYAAGLPGGHAMNPLGARALYLHQGGRDTFYRIHGTPQPWTIGRGFSSGCIRTVNDWMIDLYDRVPVGTPVHVS